MRLSCTRLADIVHRRARAVEFCWAKFMDPGFTEDHRRFVAEHPDVLATGYTTPGEKPEWGANTGYVSRAWRTSRVRLEPVRPRIAAAACRVSR